MISRLAPLFLASLLAPALAAADTELAVSLGTGYAVKKNLYLLEDLGGGAGRFVQTRASGPWTLAGLQASQEVWKREGFKLWVGAGYTAALGDVPFYKVGQNRTSFSYSATETFDGKATYRRMQAGLGATLATGTIGEFGAFLWSRWHDLKLSGTATDSVVQGVDSTVATASRSVKGKGNDWMLELSMGFQQTHPTFKTVERISFCTAFGPSFGEVDTSRWRLDERYAERLRPTMELRFTFGFRL